MIEFYPNIFQLGEYVKCIKCHSLRNQGALMIINGKWHAIICPDCLLDWIEHDTPQTKDLKTIIIENAKNVLLSEGINTFIPTVMPEFPKLEWAITMEQAIEQLVNQSEKRRCPKCNSIWVVVDTRDNTLYAKKIFYAGNDYKTESCPWCAGVPDGDGKWDGEKLYDIYGKFKLVPKK